MTQTTVCLRLAQRHPTFAQAQQYDQSDADHRGKAVVAQSTDDQPKRQFAGRDHTTVLHAIRKFERLIKTDEAVALDIATLEAKFT